MALTVLQLTLFAIQGAVVSEAVNAPAAQPQVCTTVAQAIRLRTVPGARCELTGVATTTSGDLEDSREFFLQDASGGIAVRVAKGRFAAGDEVWLEASIETDPRGEAKAVAPVATVRRRRSPLRPQTVIPGQDLVPLVGRLVEIRGTISRLYFGIPNQSLCVGEKPFTRVFYRKGSSPHTILEGVAPGMPVHAVGVVVPHTTGGVTDGYQIRLRTPDDLVVDGKFSIIKTRHLVLGSAFAIVSLSGCLVWIALMYMRLQRRSVDIQRLLREAQAASHAKSEFVANMSHEVRTPLNGIMGLTALLLEEERDPNRGELLHNIHSCGHSLLTVINDVLDLSKIEAGKLTFEDLEFEVAPAVESAAELFSELAHRKGLELVCVIDESVPASLCGDASRLRQVLTNLIGNAVKFTSEGEVVVRVTAVPDAPMKTELHFSVSDTGIGIPTEIHSYLFSPFIQADSSTTREYGGTGLGLAISKRLVSLMGGDIGLESRPGCGARFWFRAVFRNGPANRLPVIQKIRQLKVLVFDDHAATREALCSYVSRAGHNVTQAVDAREVLDSLRRASAEAVAFECLMVDARLDVLTLADAIKSDPAICGTKLVLVSSMLPPPARDEAIRRGFEAFVSKPVRQRQIYEVLSRIASPGETERAIPDKSAPGPVSPNSVLRVLIAEDNLVNQKVTVRQLERLGVKADVAANGMEVLQALDREPYDLILMDCQMPVMDGYTATTIIRQRAGDSSPRIVALTASAMDTDRERCLACGMHDYISKPVDLESLSRVLMTAGREDLRRTGA